MSLDLTVYKPTHPGLGIPYLGFSRYRKMLARDAAGIDLGGMVGFGGDTPWPEPGTQPLVHLLHHSDCDGWLEEWECEALAPVMSAFVPPETWDDNYVSYHKRLTEMVVDVAESGGIIKFH